MPDLGGTEFVAIEVDGILGDPGNLDGVTLRGAEVGGIASGVGAGNESQSCEFTEAGNGLVDGAKGPCRVDDGIVDEFEDRVRESDDLISQIEALEMGRLYSVVIQGRSHELAHHHCCVGPRRQGESQSQASPFGVPPLALARARGPALE